jgi:hypothetical protein
MIFARFYAIWRWGDKENSGTSGTEKRVRDRGRARQKGNADVGKIKIERRKGRRRGKNVNVVMARAPPDKEGRSDKKRASRPIMIDLPF